MYKRRKKQPYYVQEYLRFWECGYYFPYIAGLPRRSMMTGSRPSVSVHLRIPSIMLMSTGLDAASATNSCRLWQAIPDGSLSM